MPQELTKQDILELFKVSDARFEKRLEKSRKELEKDLEKNRKEFELRAKKLDQQIGNLTGTWGRFVEELVAPNSINLFRERGIDVTTSAQNIKRKIDGKDHYEIDLLLHNDKYVIVVEVKSNLKVSDVDEHLERLEKIQKEPPSIINLKGKILLGAVAGIIVDGDADKYAYKKGLYVLRQQGNIVEIVNDEDFVPREWKMK